ncbi:sensor histidine kinase [Anaerocolumna sp.]|uniref:sensor histidine kinase n=1 Tax=Anaerocolumna sp. TaxID=2041569 RepID=UPI0028AF75B2|nr:histidine kinase [Anaerocolumna sp.]
MRKFQQLRLFTQIIILTLITVIVFSSYLLYYTHSAEKFYENKSKDYTNEIIYQLEETIISNHSFLSKIIQFVSYHADVQNFLLESSYEMKYQYYRQMITNLTSVMTLNPHILDVIIRDNLGNQYSLIDTNYELPQNYIGVNSIELSPIQYNQQLKSAYFVMHYPINSISTYIKVNQKIGDVYLVLNDTAFLDQSAKHYNKTNSVFYIMDHTKHIFWTNGDSSLPLLSDLSDEDYQITEVERCGLSIISFRKQEDTIYGLLSVQNFHRMILFLITLMILILWILLIINIISPLHKLVHFISSLKEGDLEDLKKHVHLDGYKEIMIVSKETNEMLEKIDALTNSLITTNNHLFKIELEKKQAELLHLRSQINPHFLYNTLECIKGIAAEHKQPEIVSATKSLATIFKYSIKGADNVTFRDEIKIVSNYISIQKMRFEDRFYVEYEINPNCYDITIPKMILQPLIENAIVHGIEGTLEPSRLRIRAYIENNHIIIEINNTGFPIAPEELRKIQNELASTSSMLFQNGSHGIGIYNVNERIRLLFGEGYGLSATSSEAEGTTFTLTLPNQTQEEN